MAGGGAAEGQEEDQGEAVEGSESSSSSASVVRPTWHPTWAATITKRYYHNQKHLSSKITVYVDQNTRRIRFDFHKTHTAIPAVIVRRYDRNFEFKLVQIEPEKKLECEKAFMREAMPRPKMYQLFKNVGTKIVRGKETKHFTHTLADEVIDYFEAGDESRAPIRLVTSALNLSDGKTSVSPLLTYDVYDWVQGPHSNSVFSFAAAVTSPVFSFSSPSPELSDCTRSVNDMGFPYVHFLDRLYYS